MKTYINIMGELYVDLHQECRNIYKKVQPIEDKIDVFPNEEEIIETEDNSMSEEELRDML